MTAEWIEELVRSAAFERWAPSPDWDAAERELDVLFLHYPVSPESLRRIVPADLELQPYHGTYWVGVYTLRMRDVQSHWFPLPASFRSFPETDVVTYVKAGDWPGLYFLSIEGSGRFRTTALRLGTGVPYHASDAQSVTDGDGYRARCGPRWSRGAAAAVLDVGYRARPDAPLSEDSPAWPLLNQFSAYLIDWRGRLRRLDEVHHYWDASEADIDLRTNTLGAANGIALPEQPELAHFAAGRGVLSWLPRVVGSSPVP